MNDLLRIMIAFFKAANLDLYKNDLDEHERALIDTMHGTTLWNNLCFDRESMQNQPILRWHSNAAERHVGCRITTDKKQRILFSEVKSFEITGHNLMDTVGDDKIKVAVKEDIETIQSMFRIFSPDIKVYFA